MFFVFPSRQELMEMFFVFPSRQELMENYVFRMQGSSLAHEGKNSMDRRLWLDENFDKIGLIYRDKVFASSIPQV